MPKLSNSLPKYRCHKASGQAIVTLAGKHHYLGPYGTKASRLEYDRLIAEWVANGRSASPDSRESDMTVIEVAARYWKFAEKYYRKHGRPTGTLRFIRHALRPVKTLYGTRHASSFGPLALKAVQQALIDSGTGRPNMRTAGTEKEKRRSSRRYVNDCIAVIKRMFRWAASEELVPVTVYQALATVPGLRKGRTEARETGPVLPVADAVVDATLVHLPPVVADMVRFQRLTGCRPGEVCSLRPCDVDRSAALWRYVPSSHKTEHFGRERTIVIGPKAQAVLRPYLLRDATSYCFSPAESEEKRRQEMHTRRRTPLRYGNRPGTNCRAKPKRKAKDRYVKDSYARAIQRATKKLGIESWSPNRLRHTAATEIRRQFGLEAAQVTLGHARADVTQVYAERDLSLAERVAKEVG